MAIPYSGAFFDLVDAGSARSAELILRPVLAALRPRSVVDIGCGLGSWLAVARDSGVSEIIGVDGPWIDRTRLAIPPADFKEADLGQPLTLGRSFDLAICLETAEHLPCDRASSFVGDLVALAPVVLFSAAIPGQGGWNHVNEQWSDYWTELFQQHDYRRVDAIRWRHWDDSSIEPWYVQNAFLYLAEVAHIDLPAPVGMPARVVHPTFFERDRRPSELSRQVLVEAFQWHVRSLARTYGHRLTRRLRLPHGDPSDC